MLEEFLLHPANTYVSIRILLKKYAFIAYSYIMYKLYIYIYIYIYVCVCVCVCVCVKAKRGIIIRVVDVSSTT